MKKKYSFLVKYRRGEILDYGTQGYYNGLGDEQTSVITVDDPSELNNHLAGITYGGPCGAIFPNQNLEGKIISVTQIS
jgi:hypothetical protein